VKGNRAPLADVTNRSDQRRWDHATFLDHQQPTILSNHRPPAGTWNTPEFFDRTDQPRHGRPRADQRAEPDRVHDRRDGRRFPRTEVTQEKNLHPSAELTASQGKTGAACDRQEQHRAHVRHAGGQITSDVALHRPSHRIERICHLEKLLQLRPGKESAWFVGWLGRLFDRTTGVHETNSLRSDLGNTTDDVDPFCHGQALGGDDLDDEPVGSRPARCKRLESGLKIQVLPIYQLHRGTVRQTSHGTPCLHLEKRAFVPNGGDEIFGG